MNYDYYLPLSQSIFEIIIIVTIIVIVIVMLILIWYLAVNSHRCTQCCEPCCTCHNQTTWIHGPEFRPTSNLHLGHLGCLIDGVWEPRLHFQWRRQLHLQGRVGVVEPLGGAVAVNGLVCSWRFHGISWIQWDEMRWFLVGKTSPPTMGILHGQQLWNFHEKWWLKQPQMGISWGFDGYHLKNYPGWWSRRIPKSFNLIPFPFAIGVPIIVTTGFNTKMVIHDLDHWGVPSGNLT